MAKTALSPAVVALFLLSLPHMLAQVGGPPLHPAHPGRAHVEPCWRQVGISKSAIDERAAIGRETRAQVQAVCADKSLTPQQRQQRIREIRQQAKERADALITPQQQEALRACQKERAQTHPPAPGVHHGGAGPCGELPPAAGHPAPPPGHPEDNPPPEDEAPPQ